MKKKVSFRFDIDTHKCINEGTLPLLELSHRTNSKFTFFLNTGKAVSFIDSVNSILKTKRYNPSDSLEEHYQLSAFKKLGIKDYIYAALINPPLIKYKKNIKEIILSGNEIGLHGGKNHDEWHRYAMNWDENKINLEIEYGLNGLKFIDSNYQASGFASPGWTTSDSICSSVAKKGFNYLADIKTNKPYQDINLINGLKHIPTNIIGNNGVAFFEFLTAKSFSMREKVDNFFEKLKSRQDLAIVYDHPYWAGLNEIKTLEFIIKKLQDDDYTIIEMHKL
jgi:hypothetical protein